MGPLLHRLNVWGGAALFVAVWLVILFVMRPGVSWWLEGGTVIGSVGLFFSLRQLRDEEQGDSALLRALLSVAILGAVVFVTLHSVHSWRWVFRIAGIVAIPLLVKGFFWLADRSDL